MIESPSVLRMLKNFSKELAKYAKEGAPNVSKQDYKDRIKTCHSCEHLLRNKRCGMCGCIIEHKAKWATSDCPDGRWKVTGNNGRKVNNTKASK
jgi:hypothetical protein